MKLLWMPLGFLLCIALFVVRVIVRKLSLLKAQLAAYRRGDYATQLEIVEGFRVKGSEPSDYLFFHGSACLKLGRLDEAERALRRSLAMETVPSLMTVCRDELGRVLMEQQRWGEAETCFRKCISEAPKRGAGHRALAEVLLRRSGDRAEALEAARSGVAWDRGAKIGRGKLAREDYDTSLSESLAVFAWAAAENRAGTSEIESALTEAFALCAEATKPIMSELHFCAGQAYAALGNSTESGRHFQKAYEADPIGNYGRLAATIG